MTTPDPIDHFADWLSHRSQADRDPLSHAAAKPYRYIWASWCRWLLTPTPSRARPPASWLEATPRDVALFLDHGVQAAAHARKGKTAPISDITRRRYWRVLDAIYQHAMNKGLIERNPAEFDVGERPPPENSVGQVFHRHHWDAIKASFPRGESRWDVRDRAILALLMDTAITTGEICKLQRHQVRDHTVKVTLDMNGKRASQERDLELGTAAGVEMRRWIELRRSMSSPAGSEGALFVTQAGRALSPRAVLRLVSTTVRKAFADHSLALPDHIGAQVLRNTRIVLWLHEGVEMDEVVRRAGFKDLKSFRGLRAHIDPSTFPAVVTRSKPASHLDEPTMVGRG